MRKTFSTLLIGLAGLFLSACAPEAVDPVTVLQSEAIDAQTRAEIESLNTRVFDGFSADDKSALEELFVDTVLADIESGPGLDQVFAQLRDALAATTLAPFHEFDITLAEPREEVVEVRAEGDRAFSLSLTPTSNRMHVSLVEAKAGFRDHLVGLVYTRSAGDAQGDPPDDGWRLQALRIGALRIGGRTAMDWRDQARRLDEQGFYVPAAVRLQVARSLLRPVPFLRFDAEAQVQALEQQVANTLAQAHEFPVVLSELPGSPSVIRLDPVFQRRELLTLVSYVTTRKFDQASVDQEVLKIHEALVELFPGLCHETTRVGYKAFDEPPIDRQKSYRSINAVAPCS